MGAGTGDQFHHLESARALLTRSIHPSVSGGTLAGVAHFLKPRIPHMLVCLADPQGSGLYNKVKHNVMYATTESEGTRRRHQVDTVVEGVGINRLTRNFERALPLIDDALSVTDQEAVDMSRFLLDNDGARYSHLFSMAQLTDSYHTKVSSSVAHLQSTASLQYV